jgi:hypothetical protein
VPIASGNNVALLSKGSQTNSAGVEQNQLNANATSQRAAQSGQGWDSSQRQSTSNATDQSNQAEAVDVPIASGNNVALLSKGSQTNSAGVEQNQLNANVTKQNAVQTGSKHSRCKHGYAKSGSRQKVENRTEQSNEAKAINVPVASGNNVALLSKGSKTNSAGVEKNQLNANATTQKAVQAGSSSRSIRKHSHCKHEHPKPAQEQKVENRTEQSNEAKAINVPIASGNNVALLDSSRCTRSAQTDSAGVTQKQANVNWTYQAAYQEARRH